MPDDGRAALAGRPEREERPSLALGVERAQALLLDPVLAVEGAPRRVEERADDADDARGIEDVHGRGVYCGAIRTAVC